MFAILYDECMVDGSAPQASAKSAHRAFALAVALALSSVMSTSGCGSSDEPPVVLSILTSSTSPLENKPLLAVVDLHQKTHPDVQVTFVTMDQFSSPYPRRAPPSLIQATLGNGAYGAFAWSPSARSIDVPAADWSQAFPPAVLDQVTYEGRLLGVPLALSRQNMAYWNLKVLDTLTLTKKIPETLAELDAWLGEVSAAGYTHPLCLGGQDKWTTSWFLFNHVVPAVAGIDFSIAYWQGKLAADDPKLVAALGAAQALLPYLATDFPNLDMRSGIKKLMADESDKASQCLVAPAGDWGGTLLAESGANVPDRDFVGTGWPGANLLTVFQGDASLAGQHPPFQEAVDALIGTMASEAGQIAFSLAKGSLPARRFAEVPASFDALTRKNIADLSNPAGTAVPGFLAIARSTYLADPLATVTSEFFQTRDSTALLTFLKDNHSQLK